LAQALSILPEIEDENLLVGINTADDAGVYKVSEDLALVYTVDLLTPVVEDPYTYGQIAVANSISDIYAMGGEPKLALNVIGFPAKGDPETLGMILKGGQDKAKAADVRILGGHTFATPEIKYGLSVIGYINPKRIITNAGAKPGDIIILTKPLGKGIIVQSILIKEGKTVDLEPVIRSMTRLNREASEAMKNAGVHACTDITGYGLVGHLVEMAQASKVGVLLEASKLPIHDGAIDLLREGVEDPGIAMNMASFGDRVIFDGVDPVYSKLVFSSETSGGLVVVLSEDKLNTFIRSYPDDAPVIGHITEENPGKLRLVP